MSDFGRSLLNRSHVLSKRFLTRSFGVYIDREATLTDDLSRLESRRVRYVIVKVDDIETALDLEQAAWLRDALGEALVAADEGPIGYFDEPLKPWEKELLRADCTVCKNDGQQYCTLHGYEENLS